MEKQRTARTLGHIECACPDSTCLDGKNCVHQVCIICITVVQIGLSLLEVAGCLRVCLSIIKIDFVFRFSCLI